MNYFSPFKTIINYSVIISVPMFLPRTIAPIGGGCRRLRRHWTPRYHPGARRDPHGYPRGPWRWIGQWRPAYVSSSFLLQRFKSKPDWRRRTAISFNQTPVKIVKVNIFGIMHWYNFWYEVLPMTGNGSFIWICWNFKKLVKWLQIQAWLTTTDDDIRQSDPGQDR